MGTSARKVLFLSNKQKGERWRLDEEHLNLDLLNEKECSIFRMHIIERDTIIPGGNEDPRTDSVRLKHVKLSFRSASPKNLLGDVSGYLVDKQLKTTGGIIFMRCEAEMKIRCTRKSYSLIAIDSETGEHTMYPEATNGFFSYNKPMELAFLLEQGGCIEIGKNFGKKENVSKIRFTNKDFLLQF